MRERDPWGVTGVSVRIGPALVLDAVTLRAEPGQVVAVVGGDGAGKSTLLRTMAGVLPPAAGAAHVPPPGRIGFLSASSGVYPDLTVRENLRFVAAVYGVPAAVAGARIESLLDRTGLTTAANRLAGRLSGGMRQKLGVLRALVHEPDLLILDEPTTGVDPVSRADIWWLIAQEAARGCAVVASTTYLDEAERAAYLLVLDEGRTLISGAPTDIVEAVTGTVRAGPRRPPGPFAWRRGRSWRWWRPDDDDRGVVVRPDLQDVVVLAALRKEAGR